MFHIVLLFKEKLLAKYCQSSRCLSSEIVACDLQIFHDSKAYEIMKTAE